MQGPLRLAYERQGRVGDPVVLVHGGWDDHRLWAGVLPRLSELVQVLAPDRRGHGESAGPPRTHPVRDDAEDIARLLEATGEFPAHLVGHGYGGAVGLRLAVDRPELVRSVALHEPPFFGCLGAGGGVAGPVAALKDLIDKAHAGRASEAAEGFLSTFAAPGEGWAALGARVREVMAANAESWAEEMDDPEAVHPLLEELRGVAVPVLVTVGAQSPEFVREVALRVASDLGNASSSVLPDTGHFIPRTDPDLYVGVLGSFLLERNVPST